MIKCTPIKPMPAPQTVRYLTLPCYQDLNNLQQRTLDLLLAMQSPATTGQAAIGMTAADSRRLFEHTRHPRIAGDLITAPWSAQCSSLTVLPFSDFPHQERSGIPGSLHKLVKSTCKASQFLKGFFFNLKFKFSKHLHLAQRRFGLFAFHLLAFSRL